MKYIVLVIYILFYAPVLTADANVYKCKVDGVVSFQFEPCEELLNGGQESENAKTINIDTSVNSVKKQQSVQSNLINRARRLDYKNRTNYPSYSRSSSSSNPS